MFHGTKNVILTRRDHHDITASRTPSQTQKTLTHVPNKRSVDVRNFGVLHCRNPDALRRRLPVRRCLGWAMLHSLCLHPGVRASTRSFRLEGSTAF